MVCEAIVVHSTVDRVWISEVFLNNIVLEPEELSVHSRKWVARRLAVQVERLQLVGRVVDFRLAAPVRWSVRIREVLVDHIHIVALSSFLRAHASSSKGTKTCREK